mmetsp:Transcript_24538/g.48765  ORF Transcript_24538/g.48765 Transcript_24538/m.48765 type:complete len:314 (-) Transcript_24538:9-950(-)
MPRATNIGGDPANYLEYETFGSSSDPCVLLIMGLAVQMLAWRDEFCSLLASAGFYVVRFDNRDVGLSRHYDELGAPPLLRRIVLRKILGGYYQPASDYTLSDMASDSFGLLDFLGVPAAHVVGASMGGMIAQTMALSRPERVLSLTSIMSTTGALDLPEGELSVRLQLLKRPRPNFEDRVQHVINTLTMIAHPQSLSPSIRDYAERVIRRCFYPEGVGRQLNAIISQPDRSSSLGSLTMPVLVVHGSGDRLVPLEHGLATARAVGAGAVMKTVEGMGHVIVERFYEEVVEAIRDNAERAKGEGVHGVKVELAD